jgi:hypothetical protein
MSNFVCVFQATRSGGARPVSQHNPGPLAERALWRARHVGQGDRGHGHPGQPNLRPLSQLAFHKTVSFIMMGKVLPSNFMIILLLSP